MINLVYIPRIHIKYDDAFIRKTFEGLDIGIVENIYSFSRHTRTSQFYSAMVCFSQWNNTNPAAVNLAEKIINTEMEAKIVYDDPKYWILLPSISDKYVETEIEDGIECEMNYSNEEEINYLNEYVDKLSEENFKLEEKIKELELMTMDNGIKKLKQTNKKHVPIEKSVGVLSSVSNWHGVNPKIVRNFVIYNESNSLPLHNIPYKDITRTYESNEISESIMMNSDNKDIYKNAHFWCIP